MKIIIISSNLQGSITKLYNNHIANHILQRLQGCTGDTISGAKQLPKKLISFGRSLLLQILHQTIYAEQICPLLCKIIKSHQLCSVIAI